MERISQPDEGINNNEIEELKLLFSRIEDETLSAANMIEAVIQGEMESSQITKYFSDVMIVENYEYNPRPTGDLKKSTWGRKGVYVFVMTQDFTLESSEVRSYCEISGAGFWNTPSRQVLKAKDHFYQGSTISKSLHSRLKEHYSVECDQSALQLNNPKRIVMKDKMVVYLFPVKKELEGYPYFIRMIEVALHEFYPAKSGSKRAY